MTKEKINLRKELRTHKFEYNLLQKIPCTKQENKEFKKLLKDGGTLPQGVYEYIDNNISTSEFYTVYESDLTEAEIREYLTYKQLDLIKTIKNCVMFFTVLTVIGIVAGIFLMMNAF